VPILRSNHAIRGSTLFLRVSTGWSFTINLQVSNGVAISRRSDFDYTRFAGHCFCNLPEA